MSFVYISCNEYAHVGPPVENGSKKVNFHLWFHSQLLGLMGDTISCAAVNKWNQASGYATKPMGMQASIFGDCPKPR